MGTRFELVLPGDDEPALRSAGESALAAIEEAHATFTRFEPSGLPAHLRRVAPRPISLSTDDEAVFAAAAQLSAATHGAFDLRRAGTGVLEHRDRTVALSDAGTELDFGAIAKGFGIDRAVAVLRDAGITSAFLHGGTSSCYGLGAPPGGSGWRVRLGERDRDPVVSLRDQGFGMTATWVERDGRAEPHLRSGGRGPVLQVRRRAAVAGASAGWADGWSTAVALTGRRAVPGPDWLVWLEDEAGHWTGPEDGT